MSVTKKTYLICYDDRRTFTEDLRKKFSDASKYSVESFHSIGEFADHLKKMTDKKSFRVAIIGIPDAAEQHEIIEKLTTEISRAGTDTGIILLVAPNRMDEIKKVIKFNIDAYIPKNANSILRIHNEVKKLMSEYNINIFRKRRNVSLYVLIIFIFLCLLAILIAYLRLPGYF